MTDVHQHRDAPARPGPRTDDARFRPGARRQQPGWPTYGAEVDASADPLRRTLGPDLRTPHDAADRAATAGATALRSGATPTRPGPEPTPSVRAAPTAGHGTAGVAPGTRRRTPRRGPFWSSLRSGLLVGGVVVAVVLVLARAATGLDGESTVVVAPYGVTLVVTPLLAVACATGWVLHAVRRRSARRRGERVPTGPRPWLRRVTTALGVAMAVVVVVPQWVGFSA